MTAVHPYTQKLREEVSRLHVPLRGRAGDRRGVADDAHLPTGRVEEIYGGDRPTMDEHRKLVRALPRMKFYLPILEGWHREPAPVPPPPPEPKSIVNGASVARQEPPVSQPAPALPPTPPAPLMLVPRTFGEYVRAAREREGWSPEDLASLLGVSAGAVWNWESERSTPIATHYEQLLQALPALSAPSVPRPDVRDIAKPVGRPAPEAPPPAPAPPAIASRSPLIAFGMALARASTALGKARGVFVALLRDGAAAGLSCEEIARAIEESDA